MSVPAVIDHPTAALVSAGALGGPVTLRDELEIWQDAFEFAKAIAPTAFVPKALQNNPPAVMACIIKGHELGISALHALSSVHIIEGRPCLSAEVQRALILSKGHELWTEDHTITRVTLCGRRRGGEHVQKVTWTMDDAKRARLEGKPNWRTHPRPMLLARCSGELARIMFADVIAGMSYNVEELTDGVDETPALDAGPAETAAKDTDRRRARTRRTTKATKATSGAAAGPPATAPEGPPESVPGGPPPPLPGEEGYPEPETAPQRPQDDPPPPPPTPPADSPEGDNVAPDPGEPYEIVAKRAQAIAIRARGAGVDHHHVVSAVTHGRTGSARDINADEAAAVLTALGDILDRRAALLGNDADGWTVVAVDPFLADDAVDPDAPEAPDPAETKAETYQRRVRNLRAQQTEARSGGQQSLPDPDDEPPERTDPT